MKAFIELVKAYYRHAENNGDGALSATANIAGAIIGIAAFCVYFANLYW